MKTPHISDEQITAAFLDAVHTLLASQSTVDEAIDPALAAELDPTDLNFEADQKCLRALVLPPTLSTTSSLTTRG